jgi:hypothetical protein
MRKIIITVFILVLYSTNSNAQDTCRLNYRITTIPFQYLFNDYSFTFEKVFSNRRTLGLTLGYRPSTQNGGEISTRGLFGHYSYGDFFNPLDNAITIGINSKYYFSKYNNLFIDGNLFYRLWWFDKKNSKYINGENLDESWSGIRTERQNVYGLKLLFGNTFQIRTNIKIKPVIDLYGGVGLRYKTCRFETFNGTFYNSLFLPYKLETENYWAPSVHLGLKVGFGWINKGR